MKTFITTLLLAVCSSVASLAQTQWALPRVTVACMRSNAGHEAELASQALMGMPVQILSRSGQWRRVQTPEGYEGWVVDNSLVEKSEAEMQAWRGAERLVVTAIYQTHAYTTAEAASVRDVVTDLVNGCIVEGSLNNVQNDRTQITLPDGRKGWVNVADVTPIDEWAAQDFDPEVILNLAYSMEGSPYLWGGTSIKSLDCSGLSKVCYLANGIILLRDASQQARTGVRIEAKDWRTCQAGDLLFFGNPKTGSVTHVAIYDANGNYVHSSGRVKRNSIDPDSPDYLTTPFLHAVRIHGSEGTNGITLVRNHPWYFNINTVKQ
jgi:SH3-like domain-containing protein